MAAATETLGRLHSAKSRERIFYTAMSVVFLLVVFAGFSRTFYLRPYFQPQPLIPLLIIHGLLFSSWIALFLVQTTLVATRRTRIHRKTRSRWWRTGRADDSSRHCHRDRAR